MKLAILAQSWLLDKTITINGTLVQLHNLSRAFALKGIEVHYIASTNDKNKPSEDEEFGIHFHWFQAEKGLNGWKQNLKNYERILNEVHPDAIYVRGRNTMQLVAGKYAKKHIINYVWGTNGEDSAEFFKNKQRLFSTKKSFVKKMMLLPFKLQEDWVINKGMRMSPIIINQSINQQKRTKENLNIEGVLLPSYFLPSENVNQKKNQILWLATLAPNKQPDLFVNLLSKVELKDWKGIIGGGTSDKNYEQKIKDSARNLAIDIVGKIAFSESFNYYESARLYVNTSRPDSDGLPNAYIQSWLSGTPVLSLHHDPNNWMRDKNIGFCAHGDMKLLEKKLQELIDNPSIIDDMSKKSLNFGLETFANNNTINTYIDLFQALK
jgi:glycosyltransferase involved in cell wall biosynthesis